jgi:hypothetical protein
MLAENFRRVDNVKGRPELGLMAMPPCKTYTYLSASGSLYTAEPQIIPRALQVLQVL